METTIGYLAAICTTIAFIPQAVKVYRTNHTKDISVGMFLLMSIGLIFWTIYGIMILSYPIIIANAVTIIFAIYILFMKIRLDLLSSQLSEKKD
jgi:MtN3 and saliva related transmembrane protein